MIDEKLAEYASEHQLKCLKAVDEHGSIRRAAAALGMDHSGMAKTLRRLKANAASKGYSPEHDMVNSAPDGFRVTRISTYSNKDGKTTGRWTRVEEDQQRQIEMMLETVAAMREEIKPLPAAALPSVRTNAKLMNAYIITDYHVGMKAWPEETGAAWDTAIAEETLVRWFSAAIHQSPDASKGLLIFLGDLIHFDGASPVTPTSGHIVDADTRFQKIIRVIIRAVRRIVTMLLDKHDVLHLLFCEGNHDIAASMWMRELFAALYADDPRIVVDTRPDPYYCVEFGLVSVFAHHGHLSKMAKVETVFVAKFREVFGRTRFSYAHMGHYHHNVVHESNTMQIEQHRTLAAADAYASRGGYMSGRDAKVITYHSEYGEVGRVIVSAEMIRDS